MMRLCESSGYDGNIHSPAAREPAPPGFDPRFTHTMNTTGRSILMLLSAAAFAVSAGCSDGNKDKPAPPATDKAAVPKHAPDKEWTAEEVAADPTGYMNWADAKISKQIDDRAVRLKSLNGKLADIETRRRTMSDNLRDMANIASRMDMAVRRAEDEDRWPVQMAGRKYDRDEALAIIAQAKKYVADRQSLSGAYDQAVGKAKSMASVLGSEIAELKRLREKMALDLEAVRISESFEDLEKLRKTEQEIIGFSKALGAMADESITESLPDTAKDVERVDMDAFMDKRGG